MGLFVQGRMVGRLHSVPQISRPEAMRRAIAPARGLPRRAAGHLQENYSDAVGLAMTVPPISSVTLASETNTGFTVS